jgi:hypothetical protein
MTQPENLQPSTDHTQPAMTADDLIKAKKEGSIPTLAEVADLNLCQNSIAINYGPTRIKDPRKNVYGEDRTHVLEIEDTCLIGCYLTRTEYARLFATLSWHHHTVNYYPPRYFKGQRSAWYYVEIECRGDYDYAAVDVRILQIDSFDCRVSVNGIECRIEDYSGVHMDGPTPLVASSWKLLDKNGRRAFASIIRSSKATAAVQSKAHFGGQA